MGSAMPPDKLDLQSVLNLYDHYAHDLLEVRNKLRKFYRGYLPPLPLRVYNAVARRLGMPTVSWDNRLRPQLDDIEAEITYLLVRHAQPDVVVEFSPCGGWSTMWILNALADSAVGHLFSYDLVDWSVHNVPRTLSDGRWQFVQGDVRKQDLPADIDYLFIDSDHSADFARWYISALLPRLQSGTYVSVHDVYITADLGFSGGEGTEILRYLAGQGISSFTVSKTKAPNAYQTIIAKRVSLGLDEVIHPGWGAINSMIWFALP